MPYMSVYIYFDDDRAQRVAARAALLGSPRHDLQAMMAHYHELAKACDG